MGPNRDNCTNRPTSKPSESCSNDMQTMKRTYRHKPHSLYQFVHKAFLQLEPPISVIIRFLIRDLDFTYNNRNLLLEAMWQTAFCTFLK